MKKLINILKEITIVSLLLTVSLFSKELNFIHDISINENNVSKTLLFTQEELSYIKEKKSIKVCVHPTQYPFVIFGKDGYSGMNIEFLKEFTKMSNLEFEIIPAKNLKAHLMMLKNGKCDVSPIVLTKPNTFKFLTPAKSYISDNIVLTTRIDEPYIDDLNTLTDKKIAIQKGAKNLINYVHSLYPNMNLVEVDGNDVAKVANGKFYGQIGPSYQLSYQIGTEYFNELKIMSKIGDKKVHGSFGITNREPLLLSIFNKLLVNISPLKRQNIEHAWLKIEVAQKFDYTRFIQVISVALLIIMILIFFYLRQRKLKKQIENEKDKFENIFNSASDGITILTNGKFTDCNSSIINLLGLNDTKELLNLKPSQLSPKYQPDGRLSLDKSIEMIDIAIKNGYNHFQWLHKKADESEFWCDIMLTNISTNNDEQILHAVWRDISKQKELETEILQINSNLEQKVKIEVEKNKQQQLFMLHQNRLAQMGEMISMIAHQWRQPLSSISSAVIGMKLQLQSNRIDFKNDESVKEYQKLTNNKYDDISEYVQFLSSTIDDFRNFFRPNKIKEKVSLTLPIKRALQIVEASMKHKSIDIITNYKIDDAIEMYQNEIMQVVLNLLKNSEDNFIEKNIKNRQITISTMKENNNFIIAIKDNGGGIKEDILPNIFDPYFSTKDEKNGTGLGLYMSKTIVEEHNDGKLESSNCQDGVEFRIILK